MSYMYTLQLNQAESQMLAKLLSLLVAAGREYLNLLGAR